MEILRSKKIEQNKELLTPEKDPQNPRRHDSALILKIAGITMDLLNPYSPTYPREGLFVTTHPEFQDFGVKRISIECVHSLGFCSLRIVEFREFFNGRFVNWA